MSFTPGAPPRVGALPDAIEEQTRRVVECSTCGNHHAVFSVTAFCPVCGPRPAADKVLEAIAAAREALALENRLGADEREALRAAGIFERAAVHAIESVVSLFEIFAREQFALRVPDAERVTKTRGSIFQRLDDVAGIFDQHARIDLIALAGIDRWSRLKVAFAQRHLLGHQGGMVDARFLDQVPGTSLQVGQRIIIRRADAETALSDLEFVVLALASC